MKVAPGCRAAAISAAIAVMFELITAKVREGSSLFLEEWNGMSAGEKSCVLLIIQEISKSCLVVFSKFSGVTTAGGYREYCLSWP